MSDNRAVKSFGLPVRVMRNEKSEDVTIGMVNIGTAIANIINNTRNEIPGVYDVNITVTLEKLT